MVKVVRLRRSVETPRPTIYSKWVYDHGGAEPGEEVIVETYDRETIGVGIYDGAGPIAVRMLGIGVAAPAAQLLEENLLKAYTLRRGLGWDSYRLVNSDGDMIPGIIIDIYRDTAVIQSGSLGMDHHLETIARILKKHGIAEYIYIRNDQRSRREAGLDTWKDWLGKRGDTLITINEGEATFLVDIENGHKTGFFLDQRMNRLETRLYTRDRVVHDLYAYTGGFGIHALLSGAKKVYFIERDGWAAEMIEENIRLNKLGNHSYEVVVGDAMEWLREARGGLIIADPNAFIQSRRETEQGTERYRELYRGVYASLEYGGVAFLSSCSYFLSEKRFLEIVSSLGSHRILGWIRGASPDHVVRHDTPELRYLKAVFIYKA